MKLSVISRISWIFLLICAFVLSMKSIREPDLWWMYRTGDWMLDNGQVTFKDPFSYTFEGTNWINVKWLFEIIISLLKNLGGPEMVFVLQGFVSIGILILISKTSSSLSKNINVEKNDLYFSAYLITALLLLTTIDYRLIGRPEMSSFVMTASFIYLFVYQYKNQDSKLIFLLIPLQLLWTNLHEAFGTGMVMITAFLAGNWAEYYIRANQKKPMLLTWASLGALLAVSINPRGPAMLIHPFNIFSQLKENQYTTELFDYKSPEYWQKEAYLNLIMLFLIIFMIVIKGIFAINKKNLEIAKTVSGKNKKVQTASSEVFVSPFWNYGLGYVIVLTLLFYLSLTAYRNIPFFAIVAAPVAVLAIQYFLNIIGNKFQITRRIIPFASLLILILFYLGVVSNSYQKITNSRDEYGLQVLNGHNPVAAATFLQKNKIEGRCFSDYLTSSYLMWNLGADFKTYIDLRDLDIFPNQFFERYNMVLQDPKSFEEEDKKYGFNSVVLLRRNIEMIPVLYKYLHENSNYKLVFADPVAMVYLKNTKENFSIINQYSGNNKDIFHYLETCKSSDLPAVLNKIFNPLFKNRSYEDIDQDLIAAQMYNSIGEYELALKYADKSIKKGISSNKSYEIKASVYYTMLTNPKTESSKKPDYSKMAMETINQSLQLNPKAAESLFIKALILMTDSKFAEAIPFLQEAQKLAPQNTGIREQLSICYQKIGK
jgi:tetratricopeptide (TPR) repeat protein